MLLFVYGTLMKDLPNHYLLETSTYLGKYKTVDKYVLSIDSGIPYLSDKKKIYHIEGELYDVSDDILNELDSLEAEGEWYFRKPIKLYNDNDIICVAQAYHNDDNGIELSNGNFKNI